MKERPILFSGPMVRAILEGRKTQTRRIVKPQPPNGCEYVINGAGSHALCYHAADPRICVAPTPKSTDHRLPCPYGQPGDRLWVQEEHRIVKGGFHVNLVEYKVDGSRRECLIDNREMQLLRARKHPFAWTRGRFMYRSFSRIILEVTAVRVERLQDISEEDADAEGALNSSGLHDFDCEGKCFHADQRCDCGGGSIAKVYKRLWESINGAGSWAVNPWVWVIEFRRITP